MHRLIGRLFSFRRNGVAITTIRPILWSLLPIPFIAYSYYSQIKPVDYCTEYPEQVSLAEHKEGRVITALKYIWRFLQLTVIFLPSLMLLPLYCFSRTRDVWLRVFLRAVQQAGIVWIKAFQYLSHRRDIIGPEMAAKFSILRDHSPLHSKKETQEIFRRVYGKECEQLFDEFPAQPFASGSVSQVYKARLQGKLVAVKVRHPSVSYNLQRDIEMLFFFSRVLSCFSRQFAIPVTQDSLKRILKEQIYFLREKTNLDYFKRVLCHGDLTVPSTYMQSTDQVLIQDYVQAQTIEFYQSHKHVLNRVIAMNGAKTFFEMLLQHNFVHADCHAGNILVRIVEDDNLWQRKWRNISQDIHNIAMYILIHFGFDSPVLKRLSRQNYDYEKQIQKIVEKVKQRVQIVLIDMGMVIQLTKEKKRSFQQFLEEVLRGDPKQCALWIHRISKFRGQDLGSNDKPEYLQDLEDMFREVHKTKLEQLQGIVVLNEMLRVIRQHHMVIDGQISILLTNMLVLQAIAKDLDPHINILRCAVPYLRFQ